jgi:hypothetical protein
VVVQPDSVLLPADDSLVVVQVDSAPLLAVDSARLPAADSLAVGQVDSVLQLGADSLVAAPGGRVQDDLVAVDPVDY